MLIKRISLTVIIGLGVLLCIFGCASMLKLSNKADQNSSQLPMKVFRIVMAESQKERLFDQLRKFADKHDFEIRISDYGTDGESYLVWMSRETIIIQAIHNRADKEIVSVGFYKSYPDALVSEEVVVELLLDLRKFISEIPNVTITENQ